MLPFEDVWEEYLRNQNLSEEFYDEIKEYEDKVLSLR
jgi:L-rhamnose isomerase